MLGLRDDSDIPQTISTSYSDDEQTGKKEKLSPLYNDDVGPIALFNRCLRVPETNFRFPPRF